MTLPPEQFKARAVSVDLSGLAALVGERPPGVGAPAAQHVRAVDAALDAINESILRGRLHEWGVRCASGCAVCNG